VGIPMIAILAGMLLPVLGLARQKANRHNCLAQMRQVMLASKAFANDDIQNSMFPPDLQELVKGDYIKDTKIFQCPSSRSVVNPADVDATSNYIYLGNGLQDDGDTDLIVIYCKAHGTAGCNVGYADGHLNWTVRSPAQIEAEAKLQKERQQQMRRR
jgi:prepilin-type processing-associated H-X9-DG protein